MAKQIIMYNLKDSVTEEDYVKWCESYKGPLLLGFRGAKSYNISDDAHNAHMARLAFPA